MDNYFPRIASGEKLLPTTEFVFLNNSLDEFICNDFEPPPN